VYEIQLSEYFDKIFNPFLCDFRRGCQTTLLGLLEDWREALDKNQYITAGKQLFSIDKFTRAVS
jgi:hypothetical protein